MQTVTQSQFFAQSFNPNVYAPYGGGQQPNSRTGGFSINVDNGFNNGFSPSRPMSQMAGDFSRASFTFSGQTSVNGQTASYYAKTTIVKRGPDANPTQRPNCDRPAQTDRTDRTAQTQWTDTGVSGKKGSIDLGDYKLDFNKSNSSMLLTDKKTGDQTNIHGDPHLTQHANGKNKTTDMFNGTMTFQLPDSTKVTVGTQPAKGSKKVSFADDVTITKGDQAYQVKGLSQQSKAPLTMQKSNNGRALDAATPHGYTVVANPNGNGFIDPATGKQPTAGDLKKAG